MSQGMDKGVCQLLRHTTVHVRKKYGAIFERHVAPLWEIDNGERSAWFRAQPAIDKRRHECGRGHIVGSVVHILCSGEDLDPASRTRGAGQQKQAGRSETKTGCWELTSH